MIASFVSLAVTTAALLFMLSLPLGESKAGGALRRAAAFVFALAFVPPLLACLLAPLVRAPHSPGAAIELVLAATGLVAIAAVCSLAAYGFLDLRSRGRSRQPISHAERVRFAKRKPGDSTHDSKHTEENEEPE